jgi:MFS family permease
MWVAVVVLLAGEFLAIFDISVVNVVLPSLQRDLAADEPSACLVVAGYGLAYGSLLVVGGRMGDRFGFARVFVAGVLVFGVASLVCGVAGGLPVLVAARVAQGVGAALLFPQVLGGIQRIVPAASRGPVVGAFGAVLGLGSTLGQLGGGLLTEWNVASVGWRGVFLVNVPVCLVVGLVGWRVLPRIAGVRREFDLVGAVLLAGMLTGLVCLQWTVWGVAFAVVAGAVLVWWERRTRTPLVDLTLLRTPSFAVGLVMCLLFFGTQVPFYVALSQTAQRAVDLGPMASAELYAGLGVAFLGTSMIAGRAEARARFVVAGLSLMAVSYVGLMYVPLSELRPGFTVATGLLVLNGLGAGLVAPTLIRYVLDGVTASAAGLASGMLATAQQTANSVGVVVSGIVLASGFTAALGYFLGLAVAGIGLSYMSVLFRRRTG